MPKYHISPESGKPGVCRARTKPCPFGAKEDHFASIKEAQEFQEEYERLAHIANPALHKPHALTQAAVETALTYSGDRPEWFNTTEEVYESIWQGKPELLARLTVEGHDVAVVWQEKSMDSSDVHIIAERAINCNKLAFHDWHTGEEMGYVKAGYVTEEAIKESWGSDEFTSLRYYREFGGRGTVGTRWDVEARESIDLIDEIKNPATRLEAKRHMWASVHKTLEVSPEDFDRSQLMWGSLINLKAEHAPADEETLDRDLSKIKARMDEELEEFKISHNTPAIDYAQVQDNYRGQGLGPSMYVMAARKLAERNLPLKASGLQSDDAGKVWARMASDPLLPMKVGKSTWAVRRYGEIVWKNTPRLILDFRK